MSAVTELVFNISESAELLRRVFPQYPEINDVQTVPNLEDFLNKSRSGMQGPISEQGHVRKRDDLIESASGKRTRLWQSSLPL